MSVSLCGQCMHRLGARRRWALVAGGGAVCDGCGMQAISPRFPHQGFVVTRAELVPVVIAAALSGRERGVS